jgi:hypothetical protein
MKAILEFNLPEETEEFETASNGWKYKSVLCDLDNFLRGKLKYDNTLTPEQDEAYDKVRTELWNILNEDNLQIW